ncbi:hypothetical protein TRM7615_00729 [Falsiruegeria mediterranea M17]|uniref:DUF2867 domain-containing protein n=2 Tax=Falsiruegeria TaxID=2854184 RepID=A0A2R8C4F4_9RHOB|nr:hypothetical protein TRM7615_00729 [Falsiruegeria mediterranea M17]
MCSAMQSGPRLVGAENELDFLDRQSVTLARSLSALEAWGMIMTQPMPLMQLAFRIRDAVASKFGVKRVGGFSGRVPEQVEVGQKLDFFLVEEVSPQALVLTERDRHLDVMTCISVDGRDISITSSVKTHNWFGRLYMIPVRPVHKRIVARNLKALQASVA